MNTLTEVFTQRNLDGLMVSDERIEWIRRKHVLDIGERENSQLRVDQVDDLFIAIDERDKKIEELENEIWDYISKVKG